MRLQVETHSVSGGALLTHPRWVRLSGFRRTKIANPWDNVR